MKKLTAFFFYVLVVILLTLLVSCKDDVATSSSNGSLGQSADHSSSSESSTAHTSESTGTDSVPTEVSDEKSETESKSSDESKQNTVSKTDDNSKNTVSIINETSKAPTQTKTIVGLQANYKGYNLKLGTKINKLDIATFLKYSDGSTTAVTDITFTPTTITKEGENKIKVTSGKYETEVVVRGVVETDNVFIIQLKLSYLGGAVEEGDIVERSKIKAIAVMSNNTQTDVTDQIFVVEHPIIEGWQMVMFNDFTEAVQIPLASSKKQKIKHSGHEYYLRNDGKAVLIDFNSQGTGFDVYPEKVDGHIIAEFGVSFKSTAKKIAIPSTIDKIPSVAAFLSSQACEEIIVDEKNSYFCSVDGVLYNKDKTILIRYPVAKIETKFIIPNTVVEIAASAFNGCKYLTELMIPDSVRVIGYEAFYNWKLDGNCIVKGGKNIEKICAKAFAYSGISGFTFSEKIKEIDYLAFGVTPIKNITLPDNITKIGYSAFWSCYNLETITFGKQLTNVGATAFYGCYSLEKVNFSISLIKIGENAFGMCKKLNVIDFPTSLVEIGDNAFKHSGLTKVIIPDNVKKIGGSAFYGCESLRNAKLGKGINNISHFLFYGCEDLEEISFVGDVLYIMESAFQSNRALNKVVLPTSVVFIGKSAFEGCSSLQTINVSKGVEVKERAFEGCINLKKTS